MSARFKNIFILSFVLCIIAAAFCPALFNGFSQNDDPGHLLDNPTLRSLSPENFRAMFQSIINTTYIPLTTVSFAFEYHFFGYNPFVYHLDNLLLHLAVVAFVFLFFQRIGLSSFGAGAGALLFGVHPLHVESVAWITERKDVLYAFFYMLALLSYWRYAQSKKRAFYWVSLMMGLLSVLAKPMALSLPVILLVCDWWMGRGWKRDIFFEKVLYFLVVVPIAWITYLQNVRVPWHSVGEALMLWVWCFVFYIRKFIFPHPLVIFYQYPQPMTWANPEFSFSATAFMLMAFLLYCFRRNKMLIFSVLFYFLSIIFLLRFDDLENINPVSDRFMYLPSLGFCAFAGFGLERLMANKMRRSQLCISVIVGFLILVFSLAGKTFLQCRAWRDEVILWNEVIKRSPKLAIAYIYRGAAYQEKGDFASATADYEKAITIKDNAYAHNNLAMIYKQMRRFDQAVLEYAKAVALKPDFWGAYFDRANLYREIGKLTLAIADYTKVLELLPGYSEAYANRGTAYYFNQEDNLALKDFNYAICFDPRAINAINNRAVIYAKKGYFGKAIRDFSRSLSLDPQNASIYFNRGLAYSQSRQYDRAIADFDHALRINPNYQEAYLQKMEVRGR